MKATLKATIDKVYKDSGMICLNITGKGRVETLNLNAQECGINASLNIKEVIANKMTLGTTLTITVTDENTTE